MTESLKPEVEETVDEIIEKKTEKSVVIPDEKIIQVNRSDIENEKKSFLERLRDFLKELCARLFKYPQFSVFAQQIQKMESQFAESMFYQKVTLEELENMKTLLEQCRSYTNDMSEEKARIKEDMTKFITKDTSLAVYENDGTKYFVFSNPDSHFLMDKNNDFALKEAPDIFESLVQDTLRVYTLSQDSGFAEISKNIRSVDELQTVRDIINEGNNVGYDLTQKFEQLNDKEKYSAADAVIQRACEDCLKQVHECEDQIRSKILDSYEHTFDAKENKDEHEEPEQER